ncbi:hypothetical protein F5B17DRAFT_387477 [Nemania serpens]|nr:hypothetical protein F5B17DRAFT_387477 [Nemania serpens]
MMSRRLLTAARILRQPIHRPLQTQLPLPILMARVRTYAQTSVKVPQMAESITEGTLKQWNKQVGDYVELDEEIATIETDKVMFRPAPRRHSPYLSMPLPRRLTWLSMRLKPVS